MRHGIVGHGSFDVRHGFFGLEESSEQRAGRRDSLSADLRIEKEQGRIADRRLRRKGRLD